ncbi:MAG: type II toxin-antitoxin system HicA family toxin [Actinomycetota bacterium]|nr:type II toxin-antitoxin system HicA family toxin [Actinomycetota bacterium]
MPKASQVLAALKRDGWIEIRRKGSHITLQKRGRRVRWTHHAGEDLGNPMMARVAKTFGYTLDQLRRIL